MSQIYKRRQLLTRNKVIDCRYVVEQTFSVGVMLYSTLIPKIKNNISDCFGFPVKDLIYFSFV